MIINSKKWHYLALKCGPSDNKKWCNLAEKSLSRLFRGITSNNNGDFICLNCFHSYRTKGKLEEHKKVCNDHDYCCPEMPNKYNKILKHNHGKKSLKVPAVIIADSECLLEKTHSYQNNLEKSSTEKKAKHTPSGYSLLTSYSFDPTKNKHGCCRGRVCIKKVLQKLKRACNENS